MNIIEETLTGPGPGRGFEVTGKCLIHVSNVTGERANGESRFSLIAEMHLPHVDTIDTWLPLSTEGATNWGRAGGRQSFVDLGPGQGNLPEHSFLRVRLTIPDGQADIDSLTYRVVMDELEEFRE